MHSVNRGEIPSSLKRYGEKWTQDLTQQIELKGGYSKVENRHKTKYNTTSVQKALFEIYGDYCCYCESRITVTGYKRIEHLKPRAVFPHDCYSWNNLHSCCEVCNGEKGDKWDEENPILDPSIDNPMEFLEYRDHLIFSKDNDPRGRTTIDHVKLNRTQLEEARLRIFSSILEVLILAKEQEGTEWKEKTMKLLDLLMEDNEYITLKQYVKKTYID